MSLAVMMWLRVVRDAEVGLPGQLVSGCWARSVMRPPYVGRTALIGISSATALARFRTRPVGRHARPCTLVRMNDWPDGVVRTDAAAAAAAGGWQRDAAHSAASSAAARGSPSVQRPAGPSAPGTASLRRQCARAPTTTSGGYDSGYNTGQVYGPPAARRWRDGGPGGPPGYGRRPGAGPAPDWRRRIKVGRSRWSSLLLVTSIGTYFWADSKLHREVDLSKVIDRPGGGRRHELPDRRLRQPRGHVRRGEEEAPHRAPPRASAPTR